MQHLRAPSSQYAVIGDLMLAYNGPSRGRGLPPEPRVMERVTTALEHLALPRGGSMQGAAAASSSQVCLTVYGASGSQLASCQQLRNPDLLFDEFLGLHFWSSGEGWWVLLPDESAMVAFRGLLKLWLLVEKGASLRFAAPRAPQLSGGGAAAVAKLEAGTHMSTAAAASGLPAQRPAWAAGQPPPPTPSAAGHVPPSQAPPSSRNPPRPAASVAAAPCIPLIFPPNLLDRPGLGFAQLFQQQGGAGMATIPREHTEREVLELEDALFEGVGGWVPVGDLQLPQGALQPASAAVQPLPTDVWQPRTWGVQQPAWVPLATPRPQQLLPPSLPQQQGEQGEQGLDLAFSGIRPMLAQLQQLQQQQQQLATLQQGPTGALPATAPSPAAAPSAVFLEQLQQRARLPAGSPAHPCGAPQQQEQLAASSRLLQLQGVWATAAAAAGGSGQQRAGYPPQGGPAPLPGPQQQQQQQQQAPVVVELSGQQVEVRVAPTQPPSSLPSVGTVIQ